MSVVYAQAVVAGQALRMGLAAVILTGLVVVVFGWSPADVAVWSLVGIALWGGVLFFAAVMQFVPRGRLHEPPGTARVVDERRRPLARIGLVLTWFAVCVPMAYLADRWDIGAIFVPGQFAGYACAYALGALLIARYERRNGQRVVIEIDSDDEPTLYAM